jgi:peroxiredoxin
MLLTFSTLGFAKVEVGKPAPDFTLPGHDGKSYKLSQFKGQYVVLEWFNNDCPYVGKHYHAEKRAMQNLQQKWITQGEKAGKKVVWLAIASSPEGVQGYVTAKDAARIRNEERQAHMSAILLDPESQVARLYEAKVTPHMFIIDPKGIVRYDGAIDDQPSTRLASLDGAKNYVDGGMTALFAGKSLAEGKTKPYGCAVKYK